MGPRVLSRKQSRHLPRSLSTEPPHSAPCGVLGSRAPWPRFGLMVSQEHFPRVHHRGRPLHKRRGHQRFFKTVWPVFGFVLRFSFQIIGASRPPPTPTLIG